MLTDVGGKFDIGLNRQKQFLFADDHRHAEIFDGRHEHQQGAERMPGKGGIETLTKVLTGPVPRLRPASSMLSSTELKTGQGHRENIGVKLDGENHDQTM